MSAIFNQMIALQKLWKMFFLFHLKNFYRYRDIQVFCISVILFFSLSAIRGWSKVTLKVYDIINCLNNNFITHSVWYLGNKKNDIKKPLSIDIWVLNNVSMETLSIDRVLHKESFLGKIMQKMCTNKFSWIPKTVAVCKKLF